MKQELIKHFLNNIERLVQKNYTLKNAYNIERYD